MAGSETKRFELKEYDRQKAVAYARQWALLRNPEYANFAGTGGDCTNFVSQALFAGSKEMNYTETFGWYYKNVDERAPSWTGVEALYDFLTGNNPDFPQIPLRCGPFGYVVPMEYAKVGDVIQLADRRKDYFHTLILTEIANDRFFVCAHSNDALNRSLSSYNARYMRVIHIAGVAKELL